MDDGSKNSPFRTEKLRMVDCSIIKGVEVEIKKNEKIRGPLCTKIDTITVPRQWCHKACWVF
jgi:hypothetical protein